jgi:2'-5' RNA ligase
MVYIVVIYPEIDDSKIQQLRKKYSPYFNLIGPHLTIIFPFQDIDKKELLQHISKVLKKWSSFDIQLKGLTRSFDNWLFLTVKKGNKKIIKLHDQLYAGLLKEHLHPTIKFIPHVGIGLCKNDKDYAKVETEAKALDLDYTCKVKSIHIAHLNDNLTKIDWSKKINFN